MRQPSRGFLVISLASSVCASTRCLDDKRTPVPPTEAALSVSTDEAQVRPGEPAVIHVELRNTSKGPFTVLETSPLRDFETRVLNSRGMEPPLTERGKVLRGVGKIPDVTFRSFELILKIGEVLRADLDIEKLYELTDPGSFSVTVCRDIMELGPVLSSKIIISVQPK